MKRRLVLASVVFVNVAVTIAAGFWAWSNEPSSPVERMLGGAQVVETIREPDRVEAYRLKPDTAYWGLAKITISDFVATAGPIDVAPQIQARLSNALLSPDSYWDGFKPCVPEYGVRLAFFRGTERVDVLFCFECDMLLVFHNDRVSGGEDFDQARPVFVKAVKEVFPQDKAIQKLTAKSH